jgi:DNA-binding response OmpR family regulator
VARIIVADDVSFISRMLSAMLEKRGHETVVAENGVEAFELAVEDPPDLILLDLNMPRLDGLGVAKLLRAEPATSSVPIMVITSNWDSTTMHEAVDAGVDEYLTKPFDDKDLFDRVEKLLSRRSEAFRVRATDGVPVVVVGGQGIEVEDMAAGLRRAVEEANRQSSGAIVVDLSGIERMDPEMADTILTIHRSIGNEDLGLEVVGPTTDDLSTRLAIARIARDVHLHEDREAAVAAAKSSPSPAPTHRRSEERDGPTRRGLPGRTDPEADERGMRRED